ncbi:MAG: flagellin [SAR324 cluster bacterium]|nr:flagellin [SAR324 cluster bacterium]
MSIKNNIPALNALRHSTNNFEGVKGNIQRLSSGLKVNTAAEGPATLIASERLRGRIASMKQALENTENSVALVQTAEGGLNEVNQMLINLKQLVTHAANEAINDEKMLEADQSEINHLLGTIDRIADNTIFNHRHLLDGSNGANGVTVGPNLQFVAAKPTTQPSPEKGYEVDINQVATRAKAVGKVPIDLENVKDGITLVITEVGRSAVLETNRGELGEGIAKMVSNSAKDPNTFPPEIAGEKIRTMVMRQLQNAADDANVNVDILLDNEGHLVIRHREFGDEPMFSVTSSVDGILSKEANFANFAERGLDVEGTIGGEIALGDGQYLTAVEGTKAEGLTIRYDKELGQHIEIVRDEAGNEIGTKTIQETNEEAVGKPVEGFVHVAQQSISFQVGPHNKQVTELSIDNVRSNQLGRGVANDSGFENLSEINVMHAEGARDAMQIIDKSIDEVTKLRGRLGSFQKNALESNINSLRIAEENLTQAESTIRDADMAAEMSELTGGQILLSSSTAMLAQANQVPKSVLGLITSSQG